MKVALGITLITLASALSGCGVRVHYTYRGYAYGYGHRTGYATSYGSTNIQWNRPAPTPVPPSNRTTAITTGEVEVTGSDGSYGWQRACNADVEIHRLSEQMARKGCQFESYGYDETKAICNGVHVVLRRDAAHVYRLCPASTDRAVCQQAWAPVMAP